MWSFFSENIQKKKFWQYFFQFKILGHFLCYWCNNQINSLYTQYMYIKFMFIFQFNFTIIFDEQFGIELDKKCKRLNLTVLYVCLHVLIFWNYTQTQTNICMVDTIKQQRNALVPVTKVWNCLCIWIYIVWNSLSALSWSISAIKEKYSDWAEFLIKELTGSRTAPANLLEGVRMMLHLFVKCTKRTKNVLNINN